MQRFGYTEADLVQWALAHGAAAGSARVLARALLADSAGHPVRDRPAVDLFRAARAEVPATLPRADAVPDADGTVRFAVHLPDGNMVETVAIHHAVSETRSKERWTVCLSSQVGCARGCVFCETGALGLIRNLTAAEIVAQYAVAARHLGFAPRNVVFMGMGEPLDNLEAVLRAIAVLREPAGFAIPERRITVSTVGIVPRMDEFWARSRANLALSLHAVDEATRLAVLPVARRFTLADLRGAIERAPRPVLLQWTLIDGVNLIPLNPGPDPRQKAPPLDRCRAFQTRLLNRGIRTLLRLPHGQSVGGACGQLAGARRLRAPVRPSPTP